MALLLKDSFFFCRDVWTWFKINRMSIVVMFFCSSVAPILSLDFSHLIYICNLGLKKFRYISKLNIDLSFWNWFLWVTIKPQMEFFFTGSLNWWICSDSCRINLLRYAIMSKKCFRSYLNLEKGMSLIALTFSKSGEI